MPLENWFRNDAPLWQGVSPSSFEMPYPLQQDRRPSVKLFTEIMDRPFTFASAIVNAAYYKDRYGWDLPLTANLFVRDPMTPSPYDLSGQPTSFLSARYFSGIEDADKSMKHDPSMLCVVIHYEYFCGTIDIVEELNEEEEMFKDWIQYMECFQPTFKAPKGYQKLKRVATKELWSDGLTEPMADTCRDILGYHFVKICNMDKNVQLPTTLNHLGEVCKRGLRIRRTATLGECCTHRSTYLSEALFIASHCTSNSGSGLQYPKPILPKADSNALFLYNNSEEYREHLVRSIFPKVNSGGYKKFPFHSVIIKNQDPFSPSPPSSPSLENSDAEYDSSNSERGNRKRKPLLQEGSQAKVEEDIKKRRKILENFLQEE